MENLLNRANNSRRWLDMKYDSRGSSSYFGRKWRERMHILLSFVHRIFDDILQIELTTSGIVILEK